MTELFQTMSSENLELYSLDSDQYEEAGYPFNDDDSCDLLLEGQNDEIGSIEQSFSTVPDSPNCAQSSPSPSSTEPDQDSSNCQPVIFPSYAATQQTMNQSADEKMPAIKIEAPEPVAPTEPVVRPAPPTAHQPPVKRARSTGVQHQQSSVATETKLPDLINPENMNSYMQSLAKGKSEDIELFRNVLRCNGSLTPEAEKQLKHLARQVKNRESAQLSRQRKREFVQTLKSVIDKMRSVDNTLRTDLNNAQIEAAQYKAESERWQNYASDLQKLLQENGIQVPKIPDPAKLAVVPSRPIPQITFPETLFDGPCGFGHMSPTKCSGKRRPRSKRVKEQKETKA